MKTELVIQNPTVYAQILDLLGKDHITSAEALVLSGLNTAIPKYGPYLTNQDLADEINLSSRYISSLLTSLTDKGFIRRQIGSFRCIGLNYDAIKNPEQREEGAKKREGEKKRGKEDKRRKKEEKGGPQKEGGYRG